MSKKILLIVGPTAVGKTELSIEIAQRFNGAVISGDSMQFYRKLDIGTAKIKKSEMQGITHYMIDIRNVDERFSVADFVRNCRQKIDEILAQGKLPLIVGGTGFYLQALLDNFQLGDDSYDNALSLRSKWHKYALEMGKLELWKRLEEIDPQAAAKIPPNNERRVVRALEVFEKTGKLFSSQNDQANAEFDPLLIGLTTDRRLLYERINKRVDLMLNAGLAAEARWLFESGGENLPAGRGIGYKELYEYFEGKIELENAITEIKKNSRHYAKRQLTWFRNKMEVNWFDILNNPTDKKLITEKVQKWLVKE
ncbi:tRNA delta(2)-isopentenylpyrophosphate transferase [Liquorilactobacillus sucicola DSM 21376 = JCM 15457]|uniref:tRNA dimethylallyltransferase n=1 Tax=Liquorilactobacillus sucicola DSM 21376 = JCM 15457 TaxID=1423806 RepID=A0A023CUS5_9LACO|nr:tRNA (adenosine(37)-N6)-dimethylallyltransferase MiaA [Liquorilactobacillus sucicola]KRN05208.1 tRNA delta(2)-isopentenylpyrophosphate transferase [Liquorilactobacillus sucicola DSM 21376 = JCM 15457]GAJ25265.1 tRNA delta(2)-isopentenylpyrophosphate transferase [Liquorilactobacillus sucicola DSM 21376 = JCM 15457]